MAKRMDPERREMAGPEVASGEGEEVAAGEGAGEREECQ
jgi:hypothetical protein